MKGGEPRGGGEPSTSAAAKEEPSAARDVVWPGNMLTQGAAGSMSGWLVTRMARVLGFRREAGALAELDGGGGGGFGGGGHAAVLNEEDMGLEDERAPVYTGVDLLSALPMELKARTRPSLAFVVASSSPAWSPRTAACCRQHTSRAPNY